MERSKVCCAPGCLSSNRQSGIKFFQFPRNSARALVWAGRVGISCTIDSVGKYDVQLKCEHLGSQLPVMSKWDHILKPYEFDKPRPFRQLYKLTDTHLNATVQSVMKVKLAAHIMSHTVAASLNALVATGGCCSEYLATAAFVEEVDNLFDSFNGGVRVDQGKSAESSY